MEAGHRASCGDSTMPPVSVLYRGCMSFSLTTRLDIRLPGSFGSTSMPDLRPKPREGEPQTLSLKQATGEDLGKRINVGADVS